MIVKWNLTKTARRLRSADLVVISVSKSGRTWLRVLVNKYLSLHYGVPFSLFGLHQQAEGVPAIHYTHELWEYRSKTNLSQRLLGKYLLTDTVARQKKLVLMYRDPRDVVVSLYFQITKRDMQRVGTDMGAFIRDPRFGVKSIVSVLNAWRGRFAGHPNCLWLCYETMRRDALDELLRLLSFAGVDPIQTDMAGAAVEFAAFENMKKMESSGAFGSRILRPGDPSDPQSFKVREGSVGGYRKHFQAEDLAYLERAMADLDPFYGYTPESQR